jgi:CBS-domain-containing membrane protein
MNSKPVALRYFLPIAIVTCFSIILLSWAGKKQTPQQKSEQSITDTVPKNKADKKIRDLDDVLDELDRAELKVDMEKVNEQLKEAMKQIDMAKIQMEIDKALKKWIWKR